MADPRCIAVVTVCRNPGALLREAIDSVQALRDPRVRQIVVDGASTDGTPEYLRSMADRLHYWCSEPDGGIYDAMNKGWAAAPEDAWVIYIGADDRLLQLPGADELHAADEAGHGMVYGTTMAGTRAFRSRLDSGIRFRNTLHHQSLLVRKELSPSAPFDTRYRVYGDWDFNVRLWRQGVSAVYSPTLRAFAAPGGASAPRPMVESFRVARRHGGLTAGIVAWLLAFAAGLPGRAPTGR